MINTIIFDMDGLLIDSEPLWQQSEIAIFAKVGINLKVEDCIKTMGMRLDEVVEYWYSKHPWSNPSKVDIQNQILEEVIKLIKEKGEPKKGVMQILNLFKSLNFKIGLASSSYSRIIEAVIDKLNIREYFSVLHSAEFEKAGKPAPDVFISAAKLLNVDPSHVLVFEDSVNGVRAAKAANMYCVCIPDPGADLDKVTEYADLVMPSLEQFNQGHLRYFS